MERKLPSKKLMILMPLLGPDVNMDSYEEKISQFERKVEKSLMDTMSRLNIKGMVKTDPYSLPYKDEVVVYLEGESYLNGCWEVFRFARLVIKDLLIKDVTKLRFYVYVEVEEGNHPFSMGRVKYCFRYYV
jgi:hypothetical protein